MQGPECLSGMKLHAEAIYSQQSSALAGVVSPLINLDAYQHSTADSAQEK